MADERKRSVTPNPTRKAKPYKTGSIENLPASLEEGGGGMVANPSLFVTPSTPNPDIDEENDPGSPLDFALSLESPSHLILAALLDRE